MQKIKFKIPKFELDRLAKIALQAIDEEHIKQAFDKNKLTDIGINNDAKKQKQISKNNHAMCITIAMRIFKLSKPKMNIIILQNSHGS